MPRRLGSFLRSFLMGLLFLAPLCAQSVVLTPLPANPSVTWKVGLITLPSSATTVFTQTTNLTKGWFSNTTSSPVTIIITDNSTNCSGGRACQVWPTVTVQPNTAQAVDFIGTPANGGVKWYAGAANAIDGFIQGSY